MKRSDYKVRAIELRLQGLSYKEILESLPVSKGSLSFWLSKIKLTDEQKEVLARKKKEGSLRGARKRKIDRQEKENDIKLSAKKEITKIDSEVFKILGACLYWAEGSKAKPHNISQRVVFSNSDSKMILLARKWLLEACQIQKNDIFYELFIHDNSDKEKIVNYWSRILDEKTENIRIYFKRNKETKRKNIGDNYSGVLRIIVRKSTDLNRKISGWIDGIYENCGVVQW